ncbi:Transposable element Tcb1 transposase [Brachionus plicatilis]|uniref:Transposable element Tcb1 transposase n=1 Tax=Brachionus plicatilis TaxID=10195 RepID=A0A3M7PEX3_BRAPC|nr:Transposable element Tcb1 transposase [Brachionus plicatilis]
MNVSFNSIITPLKDIPPQICILLSNSEEHGRGKSPLKSLDLNPIEMIWNEKKEFVRKRNIQNDEEAVEEILEFQRKLTPAKCQAYINHLKKIFFLFKKDSNKNRGKKMEIGQTARSNNVFEKPFFIK